MIPQFPMGMDHFGRLPYGRIYGFRHRIVRWEGKPVLGVLPDLPIGVLDKVCGMGGLPYLDREWVLWMPFILVRTPIQKTGDPRFSNFTNNANEERRGIFGNQQPRKGYGMLPKKLLFRVKPWGIKPFLGYRPAIKSRFFP